VVTGLATIVAGVLRPERLESQHAIVIVHPGDSGGRAQRTAVVVLGPRDRQRQVATDHRTRDAGPLAHVRRPFRLERAESRRRCNLLSNSCFWWDIILYTGRYIVSRSPIAVLYVLWEIYRELVTTG